MRGLLIEVDYQSGARAGGINPRDPNLQSYGWQSLPNESGPDVEVRVVEDDRDLSQYEGEPGIRVLKNEEEVRQAIEEYVPDKENAGTPEDKEWGADLRQ